MSKRETASDVLIDLGVVTETTKGSMPGVMPDGTQPLCYHTTGLNAD